MNRLVKIALRAAPSTDIQYRRAPYGSHDIRRFLRDVIALANTAVEGPRYIVIGLDFDRDGKKRLHSVHADDFSGKPSYQSLVTDFIEPKVHLRYQVITVEDTRLGVFEISHCSDTPYMMRIDHSETLRRGDAFIRVNDAAIKLGRGQLQSMFERRFHETASAKRIEIKFPGEIIHKVLKVKTVDLTRMPSAVASSKLNQMLEIQTDSKYSGSTTVMARLTHARLFGSDNPYETKSRWELIEELAAIKLKHRGDDERFLFDEKSESLQFVILNQGDEPIEDASLSLAMPNHGSFYVADHLPEPSPDSGRRQEHGEYPRMRMKDDSIQVSKSIGMIPCGEPVLAFEVPLRVCAGSELKGRKFGVRYALSGANLRDPAKGMLRLVF